MRNVAIYFLIIIIIIIIIIFLHLIENAKK